MVPGVPRVSNGISHLGKRQDMGRDDNSGFENFIQTALVFPLIQANNPFQEFSSPEIHECVPPNNCTEDSVYPNVPLI